jgi:hypothetical protein
MKMILVEKSIDSAQKCGVECTQKSSESSKLLQFSINNKNYI